MGKKRSDEGGNRYEVLDGKLIGHRPDGSTFVAMETVDTEVHAVEDEQGRREVILVIDQDGREWLPEPGITEQLSERD